MAIDHNIREKITANGYITVDDLMREVLSTYSTSYYQHQKFIGSAGDFTTSSEISQLFGEIIGLWCIDYWQKIGSPTPFVLAELGPGRGVLMRDLLKTASLVPEFFNNLTVELIEINPHFIEWQKANLARFNVNIKWLPKIQDISKKPTLIVANEFFDALPFKQYIKVKELWYEITLMLNPVDGQIKFDKIGLNIKLQQQFLLDHPKAEDGAIFEESLESLENIRYIAKHLKKYRGAAIIIDYGYYIDKLKRTRSQYSSTLQAVKKHQYHPILETLGEADLTGHVDFFALSQAIKQNNVQDISFSSQKEFLLNYGILMRGQSLQKSSPKDSFIIEQQLQRLVSDKQMGNIFKVLIAKY